MKPVSRWIPSSPRPPSPADCRHRKLVILPEPRRRLQCRRCGRILPPEAPLLPFCPGCCAEDGVERRDFVETNIIDVAFARYQCEECGMRIRAGGP